MKHLVANRSARIVLSSSIASLASEIYMFDFIVVISFIHIPGDEEAPAPSKDCDAPILKRRD